jgi:hypothetical protein
MRPAVACIRLTRPDKLTVPAREAIALTAILAIGMFYFSFQQFYRERLAALDDRIVSRDRLLTDYQTELRGATPEEATTQIEKLTSLLADTQKKTERDQR